MWFFGNKTPASPDKTVLIIGGGIAGISAIYQLRQVDKKVKIVLVDPKGYGEVLWASYRAPFEDWVAKGSLIRLDKYCEAYNVKHVPATVTSLTQTHATLDNGKTLSFDACVVATGATADWSGMGRELPAGQAAATAESRLSAIKAEGERILNAKHVVIIGGGLIGTELAADTAAYAKKNGKEIAVTLVHSSAHLCPVMSEKASAMVQDKLEKLGVKIILNEKAEEKEGKVVLTSSGKDLEADVVIKTIGFYPRNDLVKDSFSGALNEKGWIETTDKLTIPGSDDKVFAFGDCMINLPNAGSVYMRVAETLAKNVKATLLDKKKDLQPFTMPPSGSVVTVGPEGGVMYFSESFWTQYIFPWLKNKTMFYMAPKEMCGVKKEFTLAADS